MKILPRLAQLQMSAKKEKSVIKRDDDDKKIGKCVYW